jgi:GNAT superfamily N-acetyltransferase
VLAVHDDRPIGFAVAGPSYDGEPTAQQLFAIYAREAWWGSGVGQELFDRVVEPGPCCLWLLEDNPRARAFYSRNGFEADGARDRYQPLEAWMIRMVRG